MNCKLFGAAVFVLATLVFNPVWAQDVPESDQMSTGGGQTLEDIMARQERLKADGESRSKETGNPANAAPSHWAPVAGVPMLMPGAAFATTTSTLKPRFATRRPMF